MNVLDAGVEHEWFSTIIIAAIFNEAHLNAAVGRRDRRSACHLVDGGTNTYSGRKNAP